MSNFHGNNNYASNRYERRSSKQMDDYQEKRRDTGRYFQENLKDTLIDGAFLCKSYRMVTPKELSDLILLNYTLYQKDYYKSKIPKFFYDFRKESWFRFRYLRGINDDSEKVKKLLETFIDEKSHNIENITLDKECIDYKLIDYSRQNFIVRWNSLKKEIDEVQDFIRKAPGYSGFEISVNNYKGEYNVVGILSLENDIDSIESINFLKDLDRSYEFETFQIDKMYFSKSNLSIFKNDNEDVHKIIEMFTEKYNISKDKIATLIDGKTLDFCILLLRYVFNYCYYCVQHFDSHIEMIKECGDYHIRTGDERSRAVFDRKNKLLLVEKMNVLKQLKTRTFESELCLKYRKEDAGVFSCNFCSKSYESKENVENHLKTKHQEECDGIKKEIDEYNLFIDNIDLKMLTSIEGTEGWSIPFFISATNNTQRKNETVYDIGRVFSGEIKINRNKV